MKTEQSTLDKIRTRPRFKMYVHVSRETYEEKLNKYMEENRTEFTGNINKEVATISVKTEENPFWKPTLSLRTETEDGTTVIRGVFGPSSSVWTLFMFIYFVLGILWMVFITMWFVEKEIKSSEYPWALTASFVTLFLILLTYLAARFGQQKAKAEMQKLRKFAEETSLHLEKKGN